MNQKGLLYRVLTVTVLLSFSAGGFAATNETASASSAKSDDTNAQEVLQSYLQLQEQIHATQLAIERGREETEAASTMQTKALAERLEAVEKALAAQRARELDAMQSSNRVMLVVAGAFASLGFVAMLLTAYFQWRTVNRLTDLSRAFPAAGLLGERPVRALLGNPEMAAMSSTGATEQSNQQLLGAISRLEKRIYELEHATRPTLENGEPPAEAQLASNGSSATLANGKPQLEQTATATAKPVNPSTQVGVLLKKGQSLLNLDQAVEAINCFDEILQAEPNNPEALVKKGAALEKLQKLDEAIVCYDKAIAADASMTIAYLHKGGLFNRLERFNEALACYEKALKTQEKSSPAAN